MAKRMTKTAVLAHLSKKTDLTKKQVGAVVDELVKLAYKEAKNTFAISGLGIIALAQRPARTVVMRFGPKAGQTVEVPAKKVLKFRFARAAKEAILGESAPARKDDLAIIEGVGEKIAGALNKAGIKTFARLAATPVEQLKQILSDAKFPGDPTTWPEQARLAAAGERDELRKLQEQLRGGRQV